jgi:CO/xanthine dehydrogenase FAD-binding subunit
MRPSTYYRPESVEEALQQLTQPDTVILGGVTKLLAGVGAASAVVDLQALGLDQFRFEDDLLYLGAMVRLVDWSAFLADHNSAGSAADLLQKAIRQAGPNTYRNAATAGGTIGARLVDSELLAALLVLDGELLLQTPEPQWLSLADYLGAEERPNGLITEVRMPWQSGWGGSERVARKPADYPIVSVTVWQPAGKPPRLAATGMAPRPVRLKTAEASLTSDQFPASVGQAAQAAASQASHPGDFRGSADYRAEMTAVLTRRLFQNR